MQDKTKRMLSQHQSKYVGAAWAEYTTSDLSNAVGFFAKRSTHRSTREAAIKDINDAENYLTMLREKTLHQFDN